MAERASAEDTLRRLGDRLEQASEATERLVAEAAEAAARAVKLPPAGWQAADASDQQGNVRVGGDIEQLLVLVRAVRDLIPPDLQQRLAEALRQLLLAVRALVDYYLERLEERRETPVEVQDIPVL